MPVLPPNTYNSKDIDWTALASPGGRNALSDVGSTGVVNVTLFDSAGTALSNPTLLSDTNYGSGFVLTSSATTNGGAITRTPLSTGITLFFQITAQSGSITAAAMQVQLQSLDAVGAWYTLANMTPVGTGISGINNYTWTIRPGLTNGQLPNSTTAWALNESLPYKFRFNYMADTGVYTLNARYQFGY